VAEGVGVATTRNGFEGSNEFTFVAAADGLARGEAFVVGVGEIVSNMSKGLACAWLDAGACFSSSGIGGGGINFVCPTDPEGLGLAEAPAVGAAVGGEREEVFDKIVVIPSTTVRPAHPRTIQPRKTWHLTSAPHPPNPPWSW
jgi:hypothetical protein